MQVVISGIEFVIESQSFAVLEYCRNKYAPYIVSCQKLEHSLAICVRVANEQMSSQCISPRLGFKIGRDNYILSLNDELYGDQIIATVDNRFDHCDICMQSFCQAGFDLILSVLWRIISACNGALLLHASTFVYQGKGYTCCAHSGGGKSTIIDLLQLPVLTDEMSCIKSFNEFQIPRYTTIPWRSLTDRQSTYPLGMICILEKARETYIERIPKEIASMYLRKYLYFNFWVQDSKSKVEEVIGAIVQSVPIVHLGFNLSSSRQEILNALNPII